MINNLYRDDDHLLREVDIWRDYIYMCIYFKYEYQSYIKD